MTVFNFNFTPKYSKTPKKENNKILEKDIEGVIHIHLDGNFYIIDKKSNSYIIHPKNFNCLGKANIYPFQIDKKTGGRIVYIRNENRQEMIHKAYLPFAPGLCVKGDIIIENKITYFNIKNTYIDNNNPDAKKAFEFYKDNFKEIIKNIRNK